MWDTGIIIDSSLRSLVIDKIRDACEKWGFFQVVNHGIQASFLDEMIKGVHRFNDQDLEGRKKFYMRDETKKVIYQNNFDFYQSPAANWRDSLSCVMAPCPPNPEELLEVCK